MTVDSTLAVHGMHCAGCAQHAAAAARRIDGVAQATADHITGRVRVVFDPERVDNARIAERLAAAGFPAEVDVEAGGPR